MYEGIALSVSFLASVLWIWLRMSLLFLLVLVTCSTIRSGIEWFWGPEYYHARHRYTRRKR
jgi:hypothetical protein